jgi:hypothetical protein
VRPINALPGECHQPSCHGDATVVLPSYHRPTTVLPPSYHRGPHGSKRAVEGRPGPTPDTDATDLHEAWEYRLTNAGTLFLASSFPSSIARPP